jgi:hypothetical protein
MLITAHFSKIRQEIIGQLKGATAEIKLAVAWLTDEDIVRELSHKSKNGIVVKAVISDAKENFLNIKPLGELLAAKGQLFVSTRAFMHHKFCLVDDRILINGSYNWSYPARKNEENILVLTLDSNSVEDERVFRGFKEKHNFFCNRGGIQVADQTALLAWRANPKDSALRQIQLDEVEIGLRQLLEDRIKESFDRARTLKIQIGPYLLERMAADGGGVEFVKRILHDEMTSGEMKSGFKKLEEFIPHKAELSLEYLASRTEFGSLFSEEEVAFCRKLMAKYNL